jgi:hypothetical protein
MHLAENLGFFNRAICEMDLRCLDLQTIATALCGEIAGHQVIAPGPGHSPKDRSLAVRPTATGFVTHSFSGDDWRECRDYVHDRLGLPRWSKEKPRVLPPLQRTRPQDDPEQVLLARQGRASQLWNEGHDPRGTLVEQYLASRKLNLPAEVCGSVLRFHPRCPWRTDNRVDFIPCLIVAFTSIKNDQLTAIHRIRLDQPQRWPKTERRMLGNICGAAIKLDQATDRLCVAEG